MIPKVDFVGFAILIEFTEVTKNQVANNRLIKVFCFCCNLYCYYGTVLSFKL